MGNRTIPDVLLYYPIQQPPPGVKQTFEPDHNQTAMVRGLAITAMTLVTICAALRLYTNARIIKRFSWTDYVFVATWILYVAFWGVAWHAISPGIFHQYNVYLKDAHFYLYWYRNTAVLYEFTIAIIKTVISMELIRLFVPRKRGALYWAYIAIIVVSCISGVLCGFLEAFHCTPYDKQFYPLLLINSSYGYCFDLDSARIAFSACLVLQDLALFLLPQYSIWSLKMSTRKKIGVSVLFSLGLAACIFSSVRLFYTVRVKLRIDRLWWLALLGTFLMLELSCGLLIAAAPVLPRFFKHIRDTTKFGSQCKFIFGSAKSFVSSISRKKHFKPDVTPLHNIDSTQVSANTDVTAVSADEQAKNSRHISKTVEWTVKPESPREEAALLAEQETRLPTPPRAARNSGGHRPTRSQEWNEAEAEREFQALLQQEEDTSRPAWSALPRRSDHNIPTLSRWQSDIEATPRGYERVTQQEQHEQHEAQEQQPPEPPQPPHAIKRKPVWPGPPKPPPGWI